jgi:hypothetical protein
VTGTATAWEAAGSRLAERGRAIHQDLLPRPGRQWAPVASTSPQRTRPRRRRRGATYRRTVGVRHRRFPSSLVMSLTRTRSAMPHCARRPGQSGGRDPGNVARRGTKVPRQATPPRSPTSGRPSHTIVGTSSGSGGIVRERLGVREITEAEGDQLLRIVRRSSGSVVTGRRAQMVLQRCSSRSTQVVCRRGRGTPRRDRLLPPVAGRVRRADRDGAPHVPPPGARVRPGPDRRSRPERTRPGAESRS